MNIQDVFLNQARKEKIPLTIYLVNGFQIRAVVRGFDNFTVHLVDSDGRQNILYKHAISTIIPSRNVPLNEKDDGEKEELED